LDEIIFETLEGREVMVKGDQFSIPNKLAREAIERAANLLPGYAGKDYSAEEYQVVEPILISFLRFHLANPDVYDLFCSYADMVRSKKVTKYGANAIIERLRWDVDYGGIDITIIDAFGDLMDGSFKFRSQFVTMYARLYMCQKPEYGYVYERGDGKVIVVKEGHRIFTLKPIKNENAYDDWLSWWVLDNTVEFSSRPEVPRNVKALQDVTYYEDLDQ
jgi:hypothetical protein